MVEAIDFALSLYTPNAGSGYASATPNQMDSPGFSFNDSMQSLVKLEEDSHNMFYSSFDSYMPNLAGPAPAEDSTNIAASAILDQLFHLINDPHASNPSQEPKGELPTSLEMSPSESHLSPDQYHYANSPAQHEQSTDRH